MTMLWSASHGHTSESHHSLHLRPSEFISDQRPGWSCLMMDNIIVEMKKRIIKDQLDTINNNNTTDAKSKEEKLQQKLIVPTLQAKVDLEKRIEFNRSRELMSSLCANNPQFTSSVLEDYIRPIFREGDVVLEVECGTNAAVM